MTVFSADNLFLTGFGFGYQELLIVALIFLLLFGGAKLPGLMRNMGRSINEFKAGMQDKPADASGKLNEHPSDQSGGAIEDRS